MGLTGNSGLIYDENGKLVMHINAPYDCNNKVFVYWIDVLHGFLHWRRMEKNKAEKIGFGIINCCQCDNPATQLDHHWPYMIGMNLCDDHEYDPERYD